MIKSHVYQEIKIVYFTSWLVCYWDYLFGFSTWYWEKKIQPSISLLVSISFWRWVLSQFMWVKSLTRILLSTCKTVIDIIVVFGNSLCPKDSSVSWWSQECPRPVSFCSIGQNLNSPRLIPIYFIKWRSPTPILCILQMKKVCNGPNMILTYMRVVFLDFYRWNKA